MSTEPLRLGVAGLGVVGGGLLKLVLNRGGEFARVGAPLAVTGVCARNRSRDRGVDLSGIAWRDDPCALARSEDVDVFVELIGGADGSARAAVEAAIAAGKHVVTANKALVAEHGRALAEAAEKAGVAFRYEAAVAGGVPVVRAVRDALAGARVKRVAGVLNGTCNYILTEMQATGRPYEDVLADAQRLGYAEADPAFDVGGVDAAHKIAILAALAFHGVPDFADIPVSGIEGVSPVDIAYAEEMGYRVKLLAVAEAEGEELDIRVSAALAPDDHPIGRSEGPDNVIVVDSDPVGQLSFQGPGAGEGATAAAVASDIVAIARGETGPVFAAAASDLKSVRVRDVGGDLARFYLRLALRDAPGAMAEAAATLAKHHVSIAAMQQPETEEDAGPDEPATVVFITHRVRVRDIEAAVAALETDAIALRASSLIRIEDFD
ncbi:MAG: homoserine dehydrogenase [Pseudomonadota bacterium]